MNRMQYLLTALIALALMLYGIVTMLERRFLKWQERLND